jgi:hypothetical protein
MDSRHAYLRRIHLRYSVQLHHDIAIRPTSGSVWLKVVRGLARPSREMAGVKFTRPWTYLSRLEQTFSLPLVHTLSTQHMCLVTSISPFAAEDHQAHTLTPRSPGEY